MKDLEPEDLEHSENTAPLTRQNRKPDSQYLEQRHYSTCQSQGLVLSIGLFPSLPEVGCDSWACTGHNSRIEKFSLIWNSMWTCLFKTGCVCVSISTHQAAPHVDLEGAEPKLRALDTPSWASTWEWTTPFTEFCHTSTCLSTFPRGNPLFTGELEQTSTGFYTDWCLFWCNSKEQVFLRNAWAKQNPSRTHG